MAMAGSSSMALSSYNPTDVLVLVGGQLFRAHRCILATNSGYFKSLLDAEVGHGSLSLPGLPSRAFSVLLDFMYSGHLAATGANIYEVLLCAQFLHMPRAIDLCKAYLVHQQQQQELSINPSTAPSTGPLHWLALSPFIYKSWLTDSTYARCLNPVPGSRPPTNILRPIPTKHVITPMLPTFQKDSDQLGSSTALPYAATPCASRTALTQIDVQAKANSEMPSFRWTRPDFSPAPTTSEIPVKSLQEDVAKQPNTVKEKEPKLNEENETQQLLALAAATVTSNVVIDIACCDGPVQFQRVINENYGLVCAVETNHTTNSSDKECTIQETCTQGNDKDVQASTEGSDSSAFFPYANKNCAPEESDVSNKSSKSSNFNPTPPLLQAQRDAVGSEQGKEGVLDPEGTILPTCFNGHSSSEGSGWTDSDNDTHEHTNSNAEDAQIDKALAGPQKPGSAKLLTLSAYHCVYCNHTFKSRYCYQKHKQRHINPKAFAGPASKPKQKETRAPLDMNVPFYPCKTCGSKFPSYYFVHKHRKLCHCDEQLWTDDSNTSSNTPEKD